MVILALNESYNIKYITWSENLRVIAPFEIQKHCLEYHLVWGVILLFIKIFFLRSLNWAGIKEHMMNVFCTWP